MAQKDTTLTRSLAHHSLPPAQLWIGPHDTLLDSVTTWLQKQFCTHNGCGICSVCLHIRNQQYHAISWLYPEKTYTVDDIAQIQAKLAFHLGPTDRHFFIIQKADYLTPSCANRLLKSIEEPPPGYHFFFLAERKTQLLPTIISRCAITSFYNEKENPLYPDLCQYFTTTTAYDPSAFLQCLDKSRINERDTQEVVDFLLSHWAMLYKQALIENNTQQITTTYNVIQIIKAVSELPLMPGSSKLFWRNLFLQFHK